MRNKTVIAVLSVVMIFVLAACGKTNEWVGTYGGTSTTGDKVEITINDDGTVQYKENKDIIAGTWTEREHSILLDFNGEVSSTSEPLIVTLSADKTTITVESDDSKSKKIKDVTILKITQEHPLLSGCFLVVGYNLFRIEIKRY